MVVEVFLSLAVKVSSSELPSSLFEKLLSSATSENLSGNVAPETRLLLCSCLCTADSSSLLVSEQSECTATIAEMAKTLSNLESKMASGVGSPAPPARRGEERARWSEAAAGEDPGCGETAQNAAESS